MSEPTQTKTCKTCKYHEWAGMNAICRRFPPQVYALHRERRDAFPMVGTDDWCGEWKAKEEMKNECAKIH